MSKKNIFLVEDEPIVVKDIENSLKKNGQTVVGVASEGREALEMIKKLNPDVVLMDIGLKGDIDGIDVANKLRESSQIPVIFLTANTDKNTFEKAKLTEPCGYIIKPFKEMDLFTAIELASQRFTENHTNDNDSDDSVESKKLVYNFSDNNDKKNDDILFVKSNYTLVKVNLNELAYVEALKDYVIFNTRDNRYIIHSTMKSMEDKLTPKGMIRVHRSFIVRLSDIQSVTPQTLKLEGFEKEIPIGGSYKDSLMEKLTRM